MWYNTGVVNSINSRGDVSPSRGLSNSRKDTVTVGKYTPRPAILKVCTVCGAEFSTKNNNYRYCSPGCRKTATQARQPEHTRAYHERYPERVGAAQRAYRERNLELSRERTRQTMRRWREENPEESRAKARAYYWHNAEERRAYQKWYRKTNRERVQAQWAVSDAVRRGEIPHVKTQVCVRCGSPATEYHHWSYAKDAWLQVEAMCPTCHARADRERMRMEGQ